MSPNEIVLKVVAALDACGIPFMVVGSFSSNMYGIERSTKDADLVIHLESQSVGELIKSLGSDFNFESQMGFETVTMTYRYITQHRDPPFKIELFLLSGDPHDQERFRRRRTELIRGQKVPVASPEDVIITKLRWSKNGRRTKDIDDVQGVLAVQAGRLDLPYIRHWCTQHNTLDLFDKTLSAIPPLP